MSNYVANNRPPADASPREVWEFACNILSTGRASSWADMFAVDAIMEVPLAPPGFPDRLEGREEIRRRLASAQQKAYELHPATRTALTVHETTDPEVIVCEFVSQRTELTTGRVFPMPYVHVVRVRNGEIIQFRDYAPFHLAPPSVDQVLKLVHQ